MLNLFLYCLLIPPILLLSFNFSSNSIKKTLIIFLFFSVKLIFSIIEYHYNFFGDVSSTEFLFWYDVWKDLKTVDDPAIYEQGHLFYYQVYASHFMKIGKEGELLLRMVNTLLSFCCFIPIRNIFRILLKKKNFNLSLKGIVLVSFWPSILRTTIDQGRTSVSVLFTLLSIYYLLRLIKLRVDFLNLLMFAFTTFLTYIFRVWYITFTINIFVFFHLFSKDSAISGGISKRGIKIFIIVLLFVGVVVLLSSIEFNILNILLKYLKEVMSESDQLDGGSSYLQGYFPSTTVDLFIYIPIHGFYFLFSPFLWDVTSLKLIFSALFSACTLYMTIYILINKQFKWARVLLITVMMTGMLLGVGVKNAGSAERWRIPITMFILSIYSSKSRKLKIVK